MPKMQMTEQQKRERALALAMARARVELNLPLDQDLCAHLGESKSTFSGRKKDPYRLFGWAEAGKLARKLKVTGKEVCDILGVPYAPAAEE